MSSLKIEAVGGGTGQVRIEWPSSGWATYASLDDALSAVRAWFASGAEQIPMFGAEPETRKREKVPGAPGQGSLF